MIKLITLLLTFNLIFQSTLLAKDKEIELLQEGGKVVFIRHAYAPGGGDPINFVIDDCNTQRNLNEQGINQSYTIGAIFHNNQIPIDRVLSSQWCRCLDTAKFAFDNFERWNALNSTFSERGCQTILINLTSFKSLESIWFCSNKKSKFADKFFGLTSSIFNSGTRIKFVGNPALT